MAQDIVGSLFGIQQQPDYAAQDYRNAIAMAEMNRPKQFGRFLGGMIGAPLGRAVAQEVGGLFGVQDPRLAQAAAIKEAQQQGFDVTSPEGLQQLAQFFVQKGQPALASQVAMQAQTMSRSAAEEQYKLAQAQAALREKVGSPESQAEQIKYEQFVGQYGPVAGADAFLKWKQSQKVDVASAGGVGGVVSGMSNAMAKAYGMGIAKQESEDIGKNVTSLGKVYQDAPKRLENARLARNLIEQSFTGALADTKTNLSKLAGSLGVPISEKASNTEIGTALTKNLIFDLGRVFPGSQSNLELKQIMDKNPNALQEPATQRRLWDLYEQDVKTASGTYQLAQDYKKQNQGSLAGFDIYQAGNVVSQRNVAETTERAEYAKLANEARKTGTVKPQVAARLKQLEAKYPDL